MRSSSVEGFVQELTQAQLFWEILLLQIEKVWVGVVPKWLEYRPLQAAFLRALPGTSGEPTAETRAAPQNLKLEQILLLLLLLLTNSPRSLVKVAGKIFLSPDYRSKN